MAGAGRGAGAADTRGAQQHVYQMEATKRNDQMQQDVYDHQQSLKPQEPTMKDELDATKKQLDTTIKKQNGMKTKTFMANAATAEMSPNTGKDFVKQINNDPETLKTLGAKKGDIRAFEPLSSADDVAFSMYLDKAGVDYTAWSPEYRQEVKDGVSGSGLFYNFQGDIIDGTPLIEGTGAMNSVGTVGTENYQTKKAGVTKMLEGEESWRKWQADMEKEVGADPKRKEELGKMTNEEAQADMDKVDYKMVETPASTDPTQNADGSQANLPTETAYGDEEIIMPTKTTPTPPTVVATPDGGTAKVNTNQDGSKTMVQPDGSKATLKQDGTGTVTSASGTKTNIASDGSSTTVAPDGTVMTSEQLPPHVRMAYDVLGIKADMYGAKYDPKSAAGKFASDYMGASEGEQKVMNEYLVASKASKTALSPKQYLTKQYQAGKITKEDFFKDLTTLENMKEVKPTTPNSDQILMEQARKATTPKDGETPAEFEQRVSDNYSKLKRDPKEAKLPTFDNTIAEMVKAGTLDKTDASKLLGKYKDGGDEKLATKASQIAEFISKMVQKPGETTQDFEERKHAKFIELDRNEAKDPTPAKAPDKTAMNTTYQTDRDTLIAKLDQVRLDNDPENYEPIKSLNDITQAEWDAMDNNEYNDLKMSYNNTRSELSETDKKTMTNTSKLINSIKTVTENYSPEQSGFSQNILNAVSNFTGIEVPFSADIAKSSALSSALTNIIVQQASDVGGGRPSAKLIDLIEQEVGTLSKSDKAVVAKYEKAIQDTMSTLRTQKAQDADGYFLNYRGDPLETLSKMGINKQADSKATTKNGDTSLSVAQQDEMKSLGL